VVQIMSVVGNNYAAATSRADSGADDYEEYFDQEVDEDDVEWEVAAEDEEPSNNLYSKPSAYGTTTAAATATAVDGSDGSIELTLDADNNFIDPNSVSATSAAQSKRKREGSPSISVRYTEEDRQEAIQRHKEDVLMALLDISKVVKSVLSSDDSGSELLKSVAASMVPLSCLQQQHTVALVNQLLTSFKALNIALASSAQCRLKMKRKSSSKKTKEQSAIGAFSDVDTESLLDVITQAASNQIDMHTKCATVFQLTLLLSVYLYAAGLRVRCVFAVNPCSCVPAKHRDISTNRRKQCADQAQSKKKRVSRESGSDAITQIMKHNSRGNRPFFNINRKFDDLNKDTRDVDTTKINEQIDEPNDDDVIELDSIDSVDSVDGASYQNGNAVNTDAKNEHQFVDGSLERNLVVTSWLEVCVCSPNHGTGTSRYASYDRPMNTTGKGTSSSSSSSSVLRNSNSVVDLTDDDDDSDICEIVQAATRSVSSSYAPTIESEPMFEWLVADPVNMQIVPYPLDQKSIDATSSSNSNSNSNCIRPTANNQYSYVFAVSPQWSLSNKRKSKAAVTVNDVSWKYIPHLQALINAADRRLGWADSSWLQSVLLNKFSSNSSGADDETSDVYLLWDEVTDPSSAYNKLMKANLTALPTAQVGSSEGITLASLKGHPRYVLERDLAVDEMIVSNINNVGPASSNSSAIQCLVKGEPVYLREHVQKLKTKMKWLREDFRTVIEGESASRVLKRKSRKPVSDSSDNHIHNEMKLFGKWQTEPMQVLIGVYNESD
jgi:hypothetical protein